MTSWLALVGIGITTVVLPLLIMHMLYDVWCDAILSIMKAWVLLSSAAPLSHVLASLITMNKHWGHLRNRLRPLHPAHIFFLSILSWVFPSHPPHPDESLTVSIQGRTWTAGLSTCSTAGVEAERLAVECPHLSSAFRVAGICACHGLLEACWRWYVCSFGKILLLFSNRIGYQKFNQEAVKEALQN